MLPSNGRIGNGLDYQRKRYCMEEKIIQREYKMFVFADDVVMDDVHFDARTAYERLFGVDRVK